MPYSIAKYQPCDPATDRKAVLQPSRHSPLRTPPSQRSLVTQYASLGRHYACNYNEMEKINKKNKKKEKKKRRKR
jgi:hypothetical protein